MTDNTVYLDSETTGLKPRYNEMVELSIIADDGSVLFDSLLKPTTLSEWPEAQGIHHISPDMVAEAPTLDMVADKIREVLTGKEVIIYNKQYDSAFLGNMLDGAESVKCCMLAFAEYRGIPNRYNNGYKWHKLTAAADYVGYVWEGTAHRALADTLATRAVWQYMSNLK